MGNAARLRRKEAKKVSEWDKPYTTTRRAVTQIAQQEAEKYVNEHKLEIIRQVRQEITKGVGYVMASALEEEYNFKRKRAGRVVIKFMSNLIDLANDQAKLQDHIKYWNENGFNITEDAKGNISVKIK